MNNSPEVLSPAGSWASLKAAAAAGADAVYFGASSFNARRNADNFADDEIAEVVSFCHGRGIKAYFTLNTVLFENELEKAAALAARVCAAGADAIILQDAGLCGILRACAPQMRLHASTQMSVHSGDGVRLLAKMGFSRVVLARELSLDEIAGIAAVATDLSVALEVFVHGALCMSVSGQCYMSGFFGGQRSGNRGLCAQPCRLPFSCGDEKGVLSLKDLSAVARVDRLAEIGVASLKIEGRMKRPEYVAAATAACRKAADGQAVTERELDELRAVFSRSGFTTGYLDGQRGRQMFGVRSREDVVSAAPVLKRFQAIYDGRERQSVPVEFDFSLKRDAASLTVRDPDGNTAAVTGGPVQQAITRALDEKTVAEKLSKTGGTPFFAGSVHVTLEPGLTLPVAEMNRMRRDALTLLLEERCKIRSVPFKAEAQFSTTRGKNVESSESSVRLRFLSAAQIPKTLELNAYALIFLPLRAVAQGKADELIARGVRVGAELPRAVFSGGDDVNAQLARAKELGVNDALCGNVGTLFCAARAGMTVHGDFGLNVTNSAALAEYAALLNHDGNVLQSQLLSFENSAANLCAIACNRAVGCGVIVYGRLPLMLVRNCPVRSFKGCAPDGGCSITDRLGERFPLVCDKPLSCGKKSEAAEILNPKPLWMADRKADILPPGVDFAQLYFTIEDAAQVAAVLNSWDAGVPFAGDFTRGLYAKLLE